MAESEARAGGWLQVIERDCRCGALDAELELITEDDARREVGSGVVLAIRLMPPCWLPG
jgi:hypothetical protein